jgi:hypothetical protein
MILGSYQGDTWSLLKMWDVGERYIASRGLGALVGRQHPSDEEWAVCLHIVDGRYPSVGVGVRGGSSYGRRIS